MLHHCLATILASCLLISCATVTNPVTGVKERTVMDEQSELAEGKKAHEQVLQQYGAYDNPKLQAYVNELGQRLASHSHRKNLEWHFTVIDSPEINAFALPGGYVYVTRGIMAYMENEADLAGVMSHEIGHVTARHGSQRATRQQTAGLGVLAATVLGAILESKGMSGAGQLGQLSQGVAAGSIASYSREQELQADSLGAEYLARNNYNPKNMIDVINILKNQEQYAVDTARAEGRTPQQGNNWLASHPTNDKRLQDISQIASKYQGNFSDEGRVRYLEAINGLSFGESREQGVARGRNFYHEGLGIALTAPEGWKIQNSPESIMLVNRANDAGLIVRVVPPKVGNSHEDIIRNVFKPNQGRVQQLAINSFPATHFVGTRSEQGQTQAIEATVTTGPGHTNYLLMYAAKDSQALQRAHSEIQRAEASFRALTSADKEAAHPWTIKTAVYPQGGFASLAKKSPLTNYAEQQLRLINGFYAGGEPKVGQLVKIIE